jgi:RNA polymerase sigma factor FliA
MLAARMPQGLCAHRGKRTPKQAQMTATAVKLARAKDFVRRDELVLQHLSLVTAIAARVRESLPVHVELNDLTHSGVMGLFDAADKYEGDKQVPFSTYAKHRIRGAILDSLRDLDCASRDLRRRQKQMEQVTRDLTARLNRIPTETEIAEAMGIGASRWRQLQVELRNVSMAATQNHKHESEDQELPEAPCAVETHPDRMFARLEIRGRLAAAMSSLPRRYRKVITLYYDRDMSMKEIGTMLGVNESRISQIHKSALARMQTALQASGIQSSAAY